MVAHKRRPYNLAGPSLIHFVFEDGGALLRRPSPLCGAVGLLPSKLGMLWWKPVRAEPRVSQLSYKPVTASGQL